MSRMKGKKVRCGRVFIGVLCVHDVGCVEGWY